MIARRHASTPGREERQALYYFRDEQGLEVDFLMPGRSSGIRLVECKASRTVTPSDAAPMRKLAEALRRARRGRVLVRMDLVDQSTRRDEHSDQCLVREACVAPRTAHVGVSEQRLDHALVDAAPEEIRCGRMLRPLVETDVGYAGALAGDLPLDGHRGLAPCTRRVRRLGLRSHEERPSCESRLARNVPLDPPLQNRRDG